jgi:hypothetical protein
MQLTKQQQQQMMTSQDQFTADVKQFGTEQRRTSAKHKQSIQRLEVIVGRMAKEQPNPGGHHQLKAVTVLRSGKVIGIEETKQSP